MARCKVLILQNEIPEEINEDVARRARQFGVTTMLNAAPARAFETALPDFVDILVVNAIEAEMLGAQSVGSLAEAEAAAEFLAARFAAVVVTAGGDGVAFQDRAGQKISLPSLPVKVESTHGAGDMFVGTFAARIACGDGVEAALDAANREAAKLVLLRHKRRAKFLRRDAL
jgi:ribokinase